MVKIAATFVNENLEYALSELAGAKSAKKICLIRGIETAPLALKSQTNRQNLAQRGKKRGTPLEWSNLI